MSRFFQRFVFVLSAAVFAALGLGFLFGELGWFGVHAGGQQDGAYRQMVIFRQVLSKIQTEYVTEPNLNNVTTGALQGLLESLDSDSSYLTPAEYKIYKQRPVTGVAQVGIIVSKRYGYAIVVSVLPGSPADKEHIADGDVIESIGGKSTRELPLEVIRLLLEGKPGTSVTLSVVRPRKPDPDKITLTRSITSVPALAQQQFEGATILYLKPGALSASRVDEIAAVLKSTKNQKVLVDLRDSAGGDSLQGLRLANFFVKQGTLATLDGQKFPRQTFSADPAQFLSGAPLAVIVNRGTAGPAELAAAALKDLRRGDVVGERTFGQGSVQKTFELPDAAALLITVAKYQTPAGRKISDEAVTPAVTVGQVSDEDYEEAPPAKGDAPLDKALQLLKANNSDHATMPAAAAAPAVSASAAPPATPPPAKSKPGFFRRLFGAK